MNKVISVLVTEEEQKFIDESREIFKEYSIDASYVPKDGIKVVERARNQHLDLIVMELFMPHIDAIGVISKIRKTNSASPEYLITSDFVNQAIERESIRVGAAYFMLRPFTVRELAERIIRIFDFDKEIVELSGGSDEMKINISRILHRIGVPANIRGYSYLRSSIEASVINPNIINAITKKLYPTIAEEFKTTSSRVERAIRHAIEVAWDRGDSDFLNSIFGSTVHNDKGKPTNSEFIAMVSDRMRLIKPNDVSLNA
ncbi:MAG: sporulation transcription factor Spo0A [Oscillospiraceae bacterium]|nr:sporulation transcription factor Spo0A [Oscillospiraceae bacterium]